jgi:hypothetical protein
MTNKRVRTEGKFVSIICLRMIGTSGIEKRNAAAGAIVA